MSISLTGYKFSQSFWSSLHLLHITERKKDTHTQLSAYTHTKNTHTRTYRTHQCALRTHRQTYTQALTCTQIHKYTHIHTTQTRTHTHINTRTYTPKRSLMGKFPSIDRIASSSAAAFNLHKLSSNWSPEDQENKNCLSTMDLQKAFIVTFAQWQREKDRKPLLLAFTLNVFIILSRSHALFTLISFRLSPFSFFYFFSLSPSVLFLSLFSFSLFSISYLCSIFSFLSLFLSFVSFSSLFVFCFHFIAFVFCLFF